jgi:polysaccharide pyruvyl transferase WcaK-like protein
MLGDCGVTDPISVVPDPVTLLCPPRPRAHRCAGRRRIGLALGASGHSSDFLAQLESRIDGVDWNPAVRIQVPRGALSQDSASQLSTLVTRVIAATAELRSCDNIEVCGFGAVYGDHRTAQALGVRLNCPCIRFLDSRGADALEWIESLDCLIASRLHACILALLAGTPFVAVDPYFSPVAGTSKMREFMSSIDLLSGYTTLESFVASYDSLDDWVEQAIANGERLPEIHEELSKAGHLHFDELADVIGAGAVDYIYR